MINKVGQIMLYVNDQNKAVRFWTEKIGFTLVSENDNGQGMKWLELAPAAGAETTLVLHNKKQVAEMNPELNLEPPSLLLFSSELDQLHEKLKNEKVTVGEIEAHPSGRAFNFADEEENYFAVMER